MGVGTAYSTSSRVWYTLDFGCVTEVYYPTIDTPQIRDLQFLKQGDSFIMLQLVKPAQAAPLSVYFAGRIQDGMMGWRCNFLPPGALKTGADPDDANKVVTADMSVFGYPKFRPPDIPDFRD